MTFSLRFVPFADATRTRHGDLSPSLRCGTRHWWSWDTCGLSRSQLHEASEDKRKAFYHPLSAVRGVTRKLERDDLNGVFGAF